MRINQTVCSSPNLMNQSRRIVNDDENNDQNSWHWTRVRSGVAPLTSTPSFHPFQCLPMDRAFLVEIEGQGGEGSPQWQPLRSGRLEFKPGLDDATAQLAPLPGGS